MAHVAGATAAWEPSIAVRVEDRADITCIVAGIDGPHGKPPVKLPVKPLGSPGTRAAIL
jgi:hypothetical protein